MFRKKTPFTDTCCLHYYWHKMCTSERLSVYWKQLHSAVSVCLNASCTKPIRHFTAWTTFQGTSGKTAQASEKCKVNRTFHQSFTCHYVNRMNKVTCRVLPLTKRRSQTEQRVFLLHFRAQWFIPLADGDAKCSWEGSCPQERKLTNEIAILIR